MIPLLRPLNGMVCLALLLSGAGSALPAAVAAEAEKVREVRVGMDLADITAIDETRNIFTAELDVFVSWQDPEMAFEAGAVADSVQIFSGPEVDALTKTIWRAQIYPTNPVTPPSDAGKKLLVYPDGRIEFYVRVTVTLRGQLDYRRFPFDRQVLPIELESFPWNRDQVILVPDRQHTGHRDLMTLAEWNIIGLEVESLERTRLRDEIPFSNLIFNISIERESGFYLWKIFLTIIIIVSLTWVVFWMSNERLGRRAGVSSSGILTVIAYQFVTTASLPKVSYLTVADKVMILSVVTIALTMVESVLVDGWSDTNPERKLKADRLCRWIFPLGYLSSLLILGLKNGVF